MPKKKNSPLKLSMTNRVETGKCLTFTETTLYFVAFSALAIASGVLLWHPCEGNFEKYSPDQTYPFENTCNEPYSVQSDSNGGNMAVSPSNCSNFVNVYQRFTTVLQIFFVLYILQVFRMLVLYGALYKPSLSPLHRLFDGFGAAKFCFSISCIIILHVYRF